VAGLLLYAAAPTIGALLGAIVYQAIRGGTEPARRPEKPERRRDAIELL
jgi:hypothetical protein